MTYGFTAHMDETATWYRDVLTAFYPTRAGGNRMVLVLAETERECGRPRWRPKWLDAYEHYGGTGLTRMTLAGKEPRPVLQ